MARSLICCSLIALALFSNAVNAFLNPKGLRSLQSTSCKRLSWQLEALRSKTSRAYTAKKKTATNSKKGGIASKISSKGFGGKDEGKIIKSQEYDALLEWLHAGGVDTSRVALADFGGLRGLMATRDIAKGEPVFQLPAEMAVDLGDAKASKEPFPYALEFLRAFHAPDNPRRAYFDLLPQADEAWTTTDHWTDAQLEMLEWEPVIAETKRRQQAMRDLVKEILASPEKRAEHPFLKDEEQGYAQLRWAVALVLSRCLTVFGPDAGAQTTQRKLLIPFLDMFNHEAGCEQVLSGRAAAGGRLSVVAGAPVKKGQQVNIEYFGGAAANDRFLQDHGFLDLGPSTKRFDRETFSAQIIPIPNFQSFVDKLKEKTSWQEDQKYLKANPDLGRIETLAIEYRIILKKYLEASPNWK